MQILYLNCVNQAESLSTWPFQLAVLTNWHSQTWSIFYRTHDRPSPLSKMPPPTMMEVQWSVWVFSPRIEGGEFDAGFLQLVRAFYQQPFLRSWTDFGHLHWRAWMPDMPTGFCDGRAQGLPRPALQGLLPASLGLLQRYVEAWWSSDQIKSGWLLHSQ